MPSKRNDFHYRLSRKAQTWGCHFDSLTELKFVISIMQDYHFLRSPVSIYYHPGTKITLDNIRRCHLRYTPDFLIRHKETFESHLVEIKPRAFENHPQLDLRKAVAENYIARKNLDWKFRVIYHDEIVLSAEQLIHFHTAASMTSAKELANWFLTYCKNCGHTFPTNLMTDRIINGTYNKTSHWKQQRLL